MGSNPDTLDRYEKTPYHRNKPPLQAPLDVYADRIYADDLAFSFRSERQQCDPGPWPRIHDCKICMGELSADALAIRSCHSHFSQTRQKISPRLGRSASLQSTAPHLDARLAGVLETQTPDAEYT